MAETTKRIVEGIWDCKYCAADEIGGLQKYCPCCGHPQDKDTKFRLGTKKRYLSEDEIKKVGTDPDWACDYCTTLNNAQFKYCKNCGASREVGTKDYFDLREEEKRKEYESASYRSGRPGADESYDNSNIVDITLDNTNPEGLPSDISTIEFETVAKYPDENHTEITSTYNNRLLKERMSKIGSLVGIVGVIALVVTGLIWLFTPRQYEGVVSEKSWEREVVVEEYRTVTESAWDRVPSGGRLLYTDEEIRRYESVFSHYETKSKQVAEQVLDGYDEHVSYSDNGNGTFTEHVSKTPRYRTEYKTEYYEEPVYKDVPIYDTKYYYEIERWVYDRTEESSGVNNDPYWPEYTLESNERVSNENEDYDFDVYVESKDKTYTYQCMDETEWNKYLLEQKVDITVSAGMIMEIQ